ncbi:hypothetical protein FDP41_000588 [Naegleria fowleri]|uniref:Transmembrane 9 superfamily member n=1 Tax=Naegleria fowleri TaxID=5763 RepID=A0A6A5CHC2_NAEFO|nr:uncharacterized protein FDP41_000588 [Naegleria fowleri]KAF0984689.1 hypothetical protein FDP41_000588 [Naegleria fowleri]CAG4716119.1 unnamed protein product [Naegleria fowleri]
MAKTSLASFIMMILIVGMTMIVVQGEEKDTNTNSNRQKKTDSVYERYDAIDLVIEKLWSKGNPSETYGYQQLPFCDVKASTATSLGEELTGSGDSVISKYDIGFQVDVPPETELCAKSLKKEDLERLRQAIKDDYLMLMYYDGIPMIVHIGYYDSLENKYYLYNSYKFSLTYNGNHVITALATPSSKVDVTSNDVTQIKFKYSAEWKPTTKQYVTRVNYFINMNFNSEELEIQWFSVINSLIFILVLTSFLTFIIIRMLRKDYDAMDLEQDSQEKEETGWKQLHADVFRFPANINLLSAILGNGAQLLSLIFCLLFLGALGAYYQDYGYKAVTTSLVIVYTFTTGINGYVSGSYYKKFGGESWIKNTVTTLLVFTLPIAVTWSILNTIAVSYGSTAALPFKTVAIIVVLYVAVSFPLLLLGAITGKNFTKGFEAPCRTKKVPREIPPVVWWKGENILTLVAGFLPFISIYIELHYLYLSMWGHYGHVPFPIVLMVVIILIAVTSCITISLIYLTLSQENHHWWWRSVKFGGASSIFIFAYSMYYLVDSGMSGILQISIFIGYTFILCLAVFLMMATVGFLSSLTFVKNIYRSIKCD